MCDMAYPLVLRVTVGVEKIGEHSPLQGVLRGAYDPVKFLKGIIGILKFRRKGEGLIQTFGVSFKVMFPDFSLISLSGQQYTSGAFKQEVLIRIDLAQGKIPAAFGKSGIVAKIVLQEAPDAGYVLVEHLDDMEHIHADDDTGEVFFCKREKAAVHIRTEVPYSTAFIEGKLTDILLQIGEIDPRENIENTANITIRNVAVVLAGDKTGMLRIPDTGITLEFVNAKGSWETGGASKCNGIHDSSDSLFRDMQIL